MVAHDLIRAADEYEEAAGHLEAAARHLRESAGHFRTGEVPRGCAHAWAGQGHVNEAETILRGLAVLHAKKAAVPGGEPEPLPMGFGKQPKK